MMTFKEIDERIHHYEEEIHWCTAFIRNISESMKTESNKEQATTRECQLMKMQFFCFVTTSYIDLLCSYKNLKRSKSNWESFYNLKIAYLIIYETINTYHKYKGDIYRTVTKENIEFYQKFFDMLNRELYEFKEEYKYEEIMPKIRNKSTAHYDKDFLEYYISYEIIGNLETKDIIRSFLNFMNPLHYFTYGLSKGEIDEFLFINSWMS